MLTSLRFSGSGAGERFRPLSSAARLFDCFLLTESWEQAMSLQKIYLWNYKYLTEEWFLNDCIINLSRIIVELTMLAFYNTTFARLRQVSVEPAYQVLRKAGFQQSSRNSWKTTPKKSWAWAKWKKKKPFVVDIYKIVNQWQSFISGRVHTLQRMWRKCQPLNFQRN